MEKTIAEQKLEVGQKMMILLEKWKAVLENREASMAQVNFLATQIDGAGRELDRLMALEKQGKVA